MLQPSIIFLILANLVPLAGVIWLGWSVFAIMLLFWIENVIVGLHNIPRILGAAGDVEGKYQNLASRAFTAVFFTFHYGIFTFVHGQFVFSMFAGTQNLSMSPATIMNVVLDYQLYWAVIALFVSHSISLFLNYFQGNEYQATTVKQAMHKPYSRVIILHITILAGGFFVQSMQQPIWGLIALIVIKIIVDIQAHLKSHAEQSDKMQGNTTA